ncbi:DoxX family protein [Pseudoduganella sp. GCM10020061]|uniref:DoxX family protein n=1 Tax=Pseudoduganella sp. GCM10020061 TaxID=3317345 RepID=UPI0036457C17
MNKNKTVRVSGGSQADLGKLILRVTLGGLILLHGIAKLKNGVGFIEGMLASRGLPTAIAYLVYVGEVLAPVLLIIGLWARAAAFVVLGNMLVAVALVHMRDLSRLNDTGGWAIELQAMFIAAALAVMLLGAGRFSAGGAGGKWN